MKPFLRFRSLKDVLLKVPLLLVPGLILFYYYLLVAGRPPRPRPLIRLDNHLPPPQLSSETLDKMLLYRKARMDSLAREGRDPRWMQQGLLEADSAAPAAASQQSLPWLEDPMALDPALPQEAAPAASAAASEPPLAAPPGAPAPAARPARHPPIPDAPLAVPGRPDAPEAPDTSVASSQTGAWHTLQPGASEAVYASDSPLVRGMQPSSGPVADTQEFSSQHPLRVCIDQNQRVRNGERVALRLLENGRIRGHLLKAGSRLYGYCSLREDRLLLRSAVLPVEGSLLPVAWQVLATDGREGIYLPGLRLPAPLNQALSPHLSSVPGWPLWSPYSLAPGLSGLLFSGGLQSLKRLWQQHQLRQRLRLPAGLPLLLVPRP